MGLCFSCRRRDGHSPGQAATLSEQGPCENASALPVLTSKELLAACAQGQLRVPDSYDRSQVNLRPESGKSCTGVWVSAQRRTAAWSSQAHSVADAALEFADEGPDDDEPKVARRGLSIYKSSAYDHRSLISSFIRSGKVLPGALEDGGSEGSRSGHGRIGNGSVHNGNVIFNGSIRSGSAYCGGSVRNGTVRNGSAFFNGSVPNGVFCSNSSTTTTNNNNNNTSFSPTPNVASTKRGILNTGCDSPYQSGRDYGSPRTGSDDDKTDGIGAEGGGDAGRQDRGGEDPLRLRASASDGRSGSEATCHQGTPARPSTLRAAVSCGGTAIRATASFLRRQPGDFQSGTLRILRASLEQPCQHPLRRDDGRRGGSIRSLSDGIQRSRPGSPPAFQGLSEHSFGYRPWQSFTAHSGDMGTPGMMEQPEQQPGSRQPKQSSGLGEEWRRRQQQQQGIKSAALEDGRMQLARKPDEPRRQGTPDGGKAAGGDDSGCGSDDAGGDGSSQRDHGAESFGDDVDGDDPRVGGVLRVGRAVSFSHLPSSRRRLGAGLGGTITAPSRLQRVRGPGCDERDDENAELAAADISVCNSPAWRIRCVVPNRPYGIGDGANTTLEFANTRGLRLAYGITAGVGLAWSARSLRVGSPDLSYRGGAGERSGGGLFARGASRLRGLPAEMGNGAGNGGGDADSGGVVVQNDMELGRSSPSSRWLQTRQMKPGRSILKRTKSAFAVAYDYDYDADGDAGDGDGDDGDGRALAALPNGGPSALPGQGPCDDRGDDSSTADDRGDANNGKSGGSRQRDAIGVLMDDLDDDEDTAKTGGAEGERCAEAGGSTSQKQRSLTMSPVSGCHPNADAPASRSPSSPPSQPPMLAPPSRARGSLGDGPLEQVIGTLPMSPAARVSSYGITSTSISAIRTPFAASVVALPASTPVGIAAATTVHAVEAQAAVTSERPGAAPVWQASSAQLADTNGEGGDAVGPGLCSFLTAPIAATATAAAATQGAGVSCKPTFAMDSEGASVLGTHMEGTSRAMASIAVAASATIFPAIADGHGGVETITRPLDGWTLTEHRKPRGVISFRLVLGQDSMAAKRVAKAVVAAPPLQQMPSRD